MQTRDVTSRCPEDFDKWYCLNGASCFSLKISDATLYNCWCPKGYHGLRCEYKYFERKQEPNEANNEISADNYDDQQLAVALGLNRSYDNKLESSTKRDFPLIGTAYEGVSSLISDRHSQAPQQAKELAVMVCHIVIMLLLLIALVIIFVGMIKQKLSRFQATQVGSIDSHQDRSHHRQQQSEVLSIVGLAKGDSAPVQMEPRQSSFVAAATVSSKVITISGRCSDCNQLSRPKSPEKRHETKLFKPNDRSTLSS